MAEPIVLATCARWPVLSASDECLAQALRARGRTVEVAPWNGPFDPFEAAAAVIIRATWDYHAAPDRYRAWLARLDAARTFNPPELVYWNLEKTYLLDLAARGAVLPPSALVAAEVGAVAEAVRALGLREAVIKPTVGASGFGVERLRPGEESAALDRLRLAKPSTQLLVQAFVPEIAAGELAGVFFEAAFSHGLRRVPAPHDFRVNAQYGGRLEPAGLTEETIQQMTGVLALLPRRPLYARIDGVLREGRFLLMEVEVNEPGLGLHLAPGAGDRLTDALLARLLSLGTA
jgi:glutathione synthase/RimK-type ligase-like ATP-grasp enzyme